MDKFSIFKKTEKFYWSINKIYYLTLFSILSLAYFFKDVSNSAEKSFIWLSIAMLITGLILKFRGLTQIEPLRGTLEEDLIFERESINIGGKSYSLDEINSIQINNYDYSGKLINFSRGNIGPALSNGTNNSVILFLKSKETKKYLFELINSNDFQNVRMILIEYHLKGKIDFWELANVLGDKNSSEIKDLTEEITKISTTH